MNRSKSFLNKLSYRIPKFTLHMVQERKGQFKTIKISSPDEAAKLLTPLHFAAEEYFMVLHLNVKYEVIGMHEAAHGTLTESLVHPREVFKAALLANSFAVLACHNHPSGSKVLPSREDYATTKQLIRAGKLLGILVIDHLILGSDSSLYSFRQDQPDLWL